MFLKTQGPSAWQYAINSVFILFFSTPAPQLEKVFGQIHLKTRYWYVVAKFLQQQRNCYEPLLWEAVLWSYTGNQQLYRLFLLICVTHYVRSIMCFFYTKLHLKISFICDPLKAENMSIKPFSGGLGGILNSILLDGAISRFLLSVSDCFLSAFSRFFTPLSLKLQHIRMPNWRLWTKQMTTLASPLLTRPSSCVWLWCIKHSASTLLSHKLQCRLALISRLKQGELVFLHNSNPPTSCLFYSHAPQKCLCWGRATTLEHRITFRSSVKLFTPFHCHSDQELCQNTRGLTNSSLILNQLQWTQPRYDSLSHDLCFFDICTWTTILSFFFHSVKM